jgi:hypothetical protein
LADPAREYLPPDLGVPCFIFVMLSGCIYVYGVFSLQRLQKDCVRNYIYIHIYIYKYDIYIIFSICIICIRVHCGIGTMMEYLGKPG